MSDSLTPFAVVILAAGSASRFGSPKQIATFRGKPLWEWSYRAAQLAVADQVVIVAAPLLQSIFPKEHVVVNHQASSGMASSIHQGILAIRAEIECAVILLADQPHVTGEHIRELVQFKTAASRYPDGTLGVPCAFPREIFPVLLALEGDQGAKRVISSGRYPFHALPFENPLDIDTVSDMKPSLQTVQNPLQAALENFETNEHGG